MPVNYRKELVVSAIGIVLITIFIFSTDPTTLPAYLLLVLPVLLFVTCNVAFRLFMQVFTGLDQARIKTVSVVLALGPTLLATLGSLGQMGIQDIGLAILLVSGFAWYLKRVQGFGRHA
jgi:hypothetical protein